MRSSSVWPSLLALTCYIAASDAILTVPSSPCASVCGDVTSTTSLDIVCEDADFDTTQAGITFQQCINCQLNSTAVDPSTQISDTQWLLYNMRYAMSYCLWGYPTNGSTPDTPCVTSRACGPLEVNIETDVGSPDGSTEYGYCADINNIAIPDCQACLVELSNEFYINNYFTILQAGCDQQPPPGTILSVSGAPFTTVSMNVTTPSSLPTFSNGGNNGPVSQEAEIGIAIGGICLLLAVSGFLVVCLGKRRRRRHLARLDALEKEREANEGGAGAAGPGFGFGGGGVGGSGVGDSVGGRNSRSGYITTMSPPPPGALGWKFHGGGHYAPPPQQPQQQQSPYPGDDSPASATAGPRQQQGPHQNMWPSPVTEKQHFSPYHSQYSSPVDGANAAQQQWLRRADGGQGLGIDHEAGGAAQQQHQHQHQQTEHQQHQTEPARSEDIEMQKLDFERSEFLREAAQRGFTTTTRAPDAVMLQQPVRPPGEWGFGGLAASGGGEGGGGTPGKAM